MTAPRVVPVPLRWNRIASVFLLLLIVAEGASQVYMRAWTGKPYQSLALYLWSPYGLVRNNPRLTSPRFEINPNGFRSRTVFTREKPPRTLRVLMLGGSVLYSGLVPGAGSVNEKAPSSDQTMAQHLQRLMEADTAMAGVKIEVINAGVNFNRAAEVTAGYLSEWIFWNPDLVIVCGSGNNFVPHWPAPLKPGTRNWIQMDHPWRAEFNRVVNRNSLASWAEVTARAAAEHLASVALLNKVSQKTVDLAIAKTQARALTSDTLPHAREFADWSEIQAMMYDYFGYSDAILAGAHAHGQHVAFFWEYFLGALEHVKPLSAEEKRVLPMGGRQLTEPRDLQFHLAMRDSVRARVTSLGAEFIDPLPELATHSPNVFMDYLHYTSDGNKWMAGVMYSRLAPGLQAQARLIRAGR